MVLPVQGEEGDWTRMLNQIYVTFWCFSHFISECFFYRARPSERSGEDIDIILARLKTVKAFERFYPSLLHQICLCGFYECLEKGITCTPTGRPPSWCCSSYTLTVSYVRLRIQRLSFSVPSGRHWHQLVRRPLGFAGCQSLRDLLSWGKGEFKPHHITTPFAIVALVMHFTLILLYRLYK